MVEIKPGGYKLHQEVWEKEIEIIKATLKGWVGVDYKPIAMASQLVEGTNFIKSIILKVIWYWVWENRGDPFYKKWE
jgi:hypothetical protein